jgi:CRP-like cAMP-binding protein
VHLLTALDSFFLVPHSSLSYASTMEVLETARVDVYSMHDIIVPASRRGHLLCVVWEGTCAERKASKSDVRRSSKTSLNAIAEDSGSPTAIWHAGDWTGPVSLQPELRLSGDSDTSKDHDVVAVSSEGVKVITVECSGLEAILRSGSALYRKYLARKAHQKRAALDISTSKQRSSTTSLDDAMLHLNVLELINCNSALRKLNAVQKRHLESLAEGPASFQPGERLWRAGTPVDRGFVIVSGTASFVPKRRNAGSASLIGKDKNGEPAVEDSMKSDAAKAMKELGVKPSEGEDGEDGEDDESSSSSMSSEEKGEKEAGNTNFDTDDYANLSRGLQKRADYLQQEGSASPSDLSAGDEDLDVSEIDFTFTDDADPGDRSRRNSVLRRRSSRARFANKVLGRLYNRRAFTGGLVFSRGHFLADVSKMVACLVTNTEHDDVYAPNYGFGDKEDDGSASDRFEDITEMVLHEQASEHHVMHSSTLTAGKDGCVVLVFPKASLIPFLDEFPGLLLSLLGTQVVI